VEVAKIKNKTGPWKGWPNSNTNEKRDKLSLAQFHRGGRHDSRRNNRDKIEDCILFSLFNNCPISERWVQNTMHDVT
jgi:hypothetical protein